METREINYFSNTKKYHKGEDTPRHIPVEIHLPTVFNKRIICFQAFDKFSRHLEKSISSSDIFTSFVSKNFFQLERFLNETNHDD